MYHIGNSWKFGKHGKLYHGAYAYDNAVRQMRAIKSSRYRRAHGLPTWQQEMRSNRRRTLRKVRITGRKATLHSRTITHTLGY